VATIQVWYRRVSGVISPGTSIMIHTGIIVLLIFHGETLKLRTC
jgi:hypothetical protein